MLFSTVLAVAALAASAAPSPSASADILTYYPPAAKAEHLGGSATLRCRSTIHLAFTGCVVVSEQPVGHGFGKAALAIAAASRELPAITLPPEQAAIPKTFTLSFDPALGIITPNPLADNAVPGVPTWTTRPTDDDIAKALRQANTPAGAIGHTKMTCGIGPTGQMSGCQLTSETPAGKGYGEATLKLADHFKITTETQFGFSTVGWTITIPMNFVPPR